MARADKPPGGTGDRLLDSTGPRLDDDRGPGTAETQLRDLSTLIPGAFYRFRHTPDDEYTLDFITDGIRSITGVPDDVALTDFSEWVNRIPSEYVEPFLESIRNSREQMIPWTHEWPVDFPAGRIWFLGVSQPHADDDGSVVWNGLLFDITPRKKVEEQLGRIQTDYQSIFENTNEGIVRTSPDGRLLDANGPLVRMHRCVSREDLMARVKDIATDWYVNPEDRRRYLALVERDGYVEDFETEIYRVGTGERFWSQVNSRAIHNADGELLHYQGTIRDITEQYRARQLAARRGEILEMIARGKPLETVLHEVIGTLDGYLERTTAAIVRLQDGRIDVAAAPELSNACTEALQGAVPGELGGAAATAVRFDTARVASEQADRSRSADRLRVAMRAADYDDLLSEPVRHHDGTVLGFVTVFAETTADIDDEMRKVIHEMAQITAIAFEQHRLTERLIDQAQHDTLTKLPNRALLDDHMHQLLLEAERYGHSVAVLMLDLDEFKRVNDTLGHKAGDTLLREVAARLQGCVRAPDTVARFGGDEFVVVMPMHEPARASDVAGRIAASLAPGFRIGDNEVTARASIGISLFPQDGLTTDSLLQAADAAMYAAKRAGKNQCRCFDESMKHSARARAIDVWGTRE